MFVRKLAKAMHLASIPLAIAYVVYYGCCIWCVLPYLIGFNIVLWLLTKLYIFVWALIVIRSFKN